MISSTTCGSRRRRKSRMRGTSAGSEKKWPQSTGNEPPRASMKRTPILLRTRSLSFATSWRVRTRSSSQSIALSLLTTFDQDLLLDMDEGLLRFVLLFADIGKQPISGLGYVVPDFAFI